MAKFAGSVVVPGKVFISRSDTTGDYPPSANNLVIRGEDGIDYYLGGAEAGGIRGGIEIFLASTGLLHRQKLPNTVSSTGDASARSDMDAAGIIPPGGWLSTTFGSAGNVWVAIPETPYIVYFAATAGGVSVHRGLAYYKIDSAGNLVLMGGYAGKTDGLDSQFSPFDDFAFSGVGHVIDAVAQVTAPLSGISFQYPVAVTYFGEGKSTILVIPSINDILSRTPIVENLTDFWSLKEVPLAGIGTLDNNIHLLDAVGGGQTSPKRRGLNFFLPRSGQNGSWYCTQFTPADIAEHIAGTAAPVSSFLTSNAPANPNGLISGAEIDLSFNDAEAFDFSRSVTGPEIQWHLRLKDVTGSPAYPFPDVGLKSDGSAGSKNENFYLAPSVFPSDPGDPSQPWLVFFPKIYGPTAEVVPETENGKLSVRVFEWSPASQIAEELDFKTGEIYRTGVDYVPEFNRNEHIVSLSLKWDRTSKKLTAQALVRNTFVGGLHTIIAEFGSFDPVETCAPRLQFPISNVTIFPGEDFEKDYSFHFISDTGVKITYSAAGLPAGLTMAENGVISGEITDLLLQGQSFPVTITATNACGFLTAAFTILVGTLIPLGPSFSSINGVG